MVKTYQTVIIYGSKTTFCAKVAIFLRFLFELCMYDLKLTRIRVIVDNLK